MDPDMPPPPPDGLPPLPGDLDRLAAYHEAAAAGYLASLVSGSTRLQYVVDRAAAHAALAQSHRLALIAEALRRGAAR